MAQKVRPPSSADESGDISASEVPPLKEPQPLTQPETQEMAAPGPVAHANPAQNSPPRAKRQRTGNINGLLEKYRHKSTTEPLKIAEDVGDPTAAAKAGSRLVIRKLVMENFKSYAGRKEIGPFNDSFSAIIGPNGSGKSNVIDALLFVFGWRSKEIRQQNNAGLIHKSPAHPDCTFCRVEIHFEDTMDCEDGSTTPVPNSRMVVARQVQVVDAFFGSTARRPDKGNTRTDSFFEVNGKKLSHRELAAMLERRGIDLTHRRFLILQGEVENIAMMKAKGEKGEDGLLEYLEDIIGTSQYVPVLTQLLEDVDKLREDCLLAQTELSVSDDKLQIVDAEREKSLEAFCHANDAIVSQHTLESLKLANANQNLATNKNLLEESQNELNEETSKHVELSTEVEDITAAVAERQKARDAAEKEYTKLSSSLKKLRLELTRAETASNSSNTRKTKLENDLKTATSNHERTAKWLENFSNDMNEIDSKLQETSDSLETEEEELRELNAKLAKKTEPYTLKLQAKQSEAEPWREKIQNKKSEIKSVEEAIRAYASNVESATKEVKKSKENAQTKAEAGKVALKTKKQLDKELSAAVTELETIGPEIEGLEKSVAEVTSKNDQDHQALSAVKQSSNNVQEKGRVAKALETFCKQNNLTGFYGRLGSLGAIDAKYDIAISTACPRLDDFVTDSVQTAEKCVRFLREGNVGRATFISLEKMNNQIRDVSPPEGVPRLIDLIKLQDPKFKSAFYFATGDTVVADNMAQARRVAFGGSRRLKTVTLGGEIVDVSGAMSGGGNPMRGKMGPTLSNGGVSQEELSRLQKQVDASDAELKDLSAQLRTCVDRRAHLEHLKTSLTSKADAAKLALADSEESFDEYKAVHSEKKHKLEALVESGSKADASNKAKVEALKKELADLEASSEKLEQEIEGIREEILNLGGIELRVKDSKIKDLRNRIQTLRRQQEDKSTEKRSMSQKLDAYVKEQKQAQKELDALEKTVLQATEKLAQLKEQEKDLERQLPELEVQKAKLDDEINEAKEKLSELKATLSESGLKEQSLRAKITEVNAQISKFTGIQKAVTTRLSELKLHDLEPFRDLRKADDPEYSLPQHAYTKLSDEELLAMPKEEVRRLQESADTHLAAFQQAGISSNTNSQLGTYRQLFEEWNGHKQTLDKAKANFEANKREYDRITDLRRTEFLTGLEIIRRFLKGMYRLITTDGNADLELRDNNDPFEGIEFTVMPPGKSWKNIGNLSGGEKTLSSLSLVFALHKYKPTPLYVMDEIDAALDFKNVSIIANYIRDETKRGQFIVISLRNNMFEMASRLIGIYKHEDCTGSVTFDPAPPV